ncbi:hypothetical protein EZJ19_06200 [Parasulfuritortus cantonensis]|uniref:Uncharacterized protein n=1 Tax=Parasulfuritortus cantonensis TaxID=2528202 RepID=A0A4V2NW29_9PROT|nr:hypothetical protein [Parasulfuritortus cantonensis]TCJ15802.1 hypothetical protein EZJ19_06200 [Parasulfuritortus cantonensis]
MKSEITREFIADVLAESVLDPRTRALYELCFMHRTHFQDEIVADKLRMIVRVCAERGVEVPGFSPEFAAHRLGQSGVDRWFAGIATAERIDPALMFEMHKRVMDVFADMPADQARSVASKYLHFHFPELYFIYDGRVAAAAYALGSGDCGYLARSEHDPEYGRFFSCCRKLVERLAEPAGRRLTPRELDRVLRAWIAHDEAGLPTPSPRTQQSVAYA